MIHIILIFLNLLFLIFFNFLEKKINVYDLPDGKNKIHLKKTSLLGGFIFLSNILLYLSYALYFENISILDVFGFESFIANTVFIFSFIFLFFIGYLDDKITLSARNRLIILVLVILINLLINPNINISIIKLSFMNSFSIASFSHFWTLICFLLFINAFNFFDGINLQISGLILAFISFFLYKNIYVDFFLVILIANIFFGYLNYKSKTFLGNNGSFYLPFIFGSLFISAYNNNQNIVSDEIVILMLIPGLDLIRLFFYRIIKKTNPLRGDQEHVHHYLNKRYSNTVTAIIIQLLIWFPFLISQLFGFFHVVIVVQIFVYCLVILKYKN